MSDVSLIDRTTPPAQTSPSGVAATPHPARRIGPTRAQCLSWLLPTLIVLVWELFAQLGRIPPNILPAPSRVLATAIKLTRDGTLLPDMGISLLRAAGGFAIGCVIGFILGTAVGFSRIAGVLLDRTILMLRAIPFLAVLPLVIVWLGIGEGAKVFLAFGVMFPITTVPTLESAADVSSRY